ncbi:MAG: valine--tRNA ligase [Gammaproteobacteria bacterium]
MQTNNTQNSQTPELDKTFNNQAREAHWNIVWEKQGLFAPRAEAVSGQQETDHKGDNNGHNRRQDYCIVIPPPNVTGSLHMGHALEQTLIDILIRTQRMLGHNTLWQVGTDHAGIATQMVVERLLMQEGLSRHDLGREAFVDKIWAWKEESGGNITRQMRRLGASVDWATERFTMDEGLSAAVQEVFIKLYEEGLIYRGQRLVNWDPILETAVSDLEVEYHEEEGSLWHLRYPLVDADPLKQRSYLVVATTRPETLFGDVAVAVHPEDPRYKHLIGAKVRIPEANREVPIIGDEAVDMEFGTGCVKITPAHDFNDYAMGKRHALPVINIFTKEARLNQEVPKAYQNLDRFTARSQLIQKITELGFLDKIEPHALKVPRGDKTASIIEPFLTDQWFVKADVLAKPAIEKVESGEIRFIPETWNKTYFEWMRNIQDWCISRQIWWGHRIPAWYDETGKAYVGKNEEEIRKKYNLAADLILKQDPDVLDGWFSSALWPFSTLGWPDLENPRYQAFYPTSVLVTGFDIIFFWVARMIMFGLHFTGKVPFKDIFIHGLVQDQNGQKMSKSKGNVIDPIDVIDGINLEDLLVKRTQGLMQPQQKKKIEQDTKKQFPKGISACGTDALRFTFCILANQARFIKFDSGRVEGYRNFGNKIWNAGRFILLQVRDQDFKFDQNQIAALPNQWIWSRWQKVKSQQLEYLNAYRFDLLAQNIYEFIWDEFCDWYIELSKPLMQNPETKQETAYILKALFAEVLLVLHPIMPYMTEELWQHFKPTKQVNTMSMMHEAYPQANTAIIEKFGNTEKEIAWLKEIVIAIRQARSSFQIAPSKPVKLALSFANPAQKERFDALKPFIKVLAKIESIEEVNAKPQARLITLTLEGIILYLYLDIDLEAEKKRLEKDQLKMQAEIDRIQKKFSNPEYVKKAPPQVIEEEKLKLREYQQKLLVLRENLGCENK